MGVDRTKASGTSYTMQYAPQNAEMYEDLSSCSDELLLFFHHVPYTHKLKSGKTLIQHIYDSHFEGTENAEQLLLKWRGLMGKIPRDYYSAAEKCFEMQLENSRRWRDVINTYFYRKSGIDDFHGRKIYK